MNETLNFIKTILIKCLFLDELIKLCQNFGSCLKKNNSLSSLGNKFLLTTKSYSRYRARVTKTPSKTMQYFLILLQKKKCFQDYASLSTFLNV